MEVDLHLEGCVGQRKGFVQKKGFKLVDAKGKQNDDITRLFEAVWFKDMVGYILDSRYWGHSLIQLGDVVSIDGEMRYTGVELVNRKHVIQEYGVIIREQGDEWQTGVPYREGPMADWVIEAGKPHDLGLYLKAATQTIPKKNMLAYWDQFGEIFGMPIRIAKTSSRDPKDRAQIENMLSNMGAAPWGMFPTDTDIEIKE
ncbi:phage portal protein family protein, partial [Parabacteroides goldsteinii]|uniref:phage portal protein family protein n=1 Tax=Parabacteroides goldsteinii TaxID=328812 RepID=UPI003F736EEB